MASWRDALGRLFRGKPGPPPGGDKEEGPIGHRGIAAGDLTKPLKPFSERFGAPETVQAVPPDQVNRFLYQGAIFPVFSSNVEAAQYDIGKHILILTFKNASQYAYHDVSEAEALLFAQSASKGGYVWSNLRIRGSKTGHKKTYHRIR